jgi:hypothetical protein
MSTELKKCPFCGGEAKHNDGGNSVFGRFWWAVWCEECQIEMRDREVWDSSRAGYLHPDYPPQECFTRWNRRHSPSDIELEHKAREALAP